MPPAPPFANSIEVFGERCHGLLKPSLCTGQGNMKMVSDNMNECNLANAFRFKLLIPEKYYVTSMQHIKSSATIRNRLSRYKSVANEYAHITVDSQLTNATPMTNWWNL